MEWRGREKGHPAFSSLPPLPPLRPTRPDGRRTLFAPQPPPFLPVFFFLFFFFSFYIAVNDGWPSLKWVGHQGPVYQGQGGGWNWEELRSADSTQLHTHTLARSLKWSPGYSSCPLSHSFCNLPLLFYFPPHFLQVLHFIIVGSAWTIGGFRIFVLYYKHFFDDVRRLGPASLHLMVVVLFS